MVIQMGAAKVFQKHVAAHDESDSTCARLELIIQKPEHSGT